MADALRSSHAEATKFHDDAVARLRGEYDRLQTRIDRAYDDHLDGRIAESYYDQRVQQWRAEQDRVTESLAKHEVSNRSYIDLGIRLLQVSRRLPELLTARSGLEKRKLLDFVVSNSVWRDGELEVAYRKPFDLIVLAAESKGTAEVAIAASGALCPEWQGQRD